MVLGLRDVTGPGSTRETRAEKTARTRERLLEAAEQLFADHGYLAVSVEDIAARAGFTRGAVYGNFEGREGVFLALAERRGEMTYPDKMPGDPEAWAREFLEAVGRQVLQIHGLVRAHAEFMVVAAARGDLQERLATLNASSHGTFDAYAAGVFACVSGLPVARARRRATVFRALLNGLLLETIGDPGFDVRRHLKEGFGALASAP